MKNLQDGILSMLIVAWTWLAPIQGILISIGLLILADTVLGLWKSKKLKTKITSRGLSSIISKLLLYQTAIITIWMIDKHIIGSVIGIFTEIPFFLTKTVAACISLVELYSMKENLDQIVGRDVWKLIKGLITRSADEIIDIKKRIDEIDTPDTSDGHKD